MNILIIGGSNFIGWRLIKKLNTLNVNIVVYNRGNHKREYPLNTHYVIGDRNDLDKLSRLIEENDIDIVYDMCAFSKKDAEGIVSLLNGRIKRYIFISSSAAYLDNQILPLNEMSKCGFHPQWGKYGSGKYECECVFMEAYHQTGFPITIISPSYVYGIENPIDRETLLFDRINRNLPLLVPYSGEAVIQLGYVDDLCDALCLLANSSKGIGEKYNVSGNEYVTINSLISMVSGIIGKEALIYHIDPKKLGFSQRQLFPFENNTYFTTTKKFCDDFGWQPKVSLKCGLKLSYDYWKKNKDSIKTNYQYEEEAMQIIRNSDEQL